MYCPGPGKDGEMSLEGETWGVEVEPSCPKCGFQDSQTCRLESPPHT